MDLGPEVLRDVVDVRSERKGVAEPWNVFQDAVFIFLFIFLLLFVVLVLTNAHE